MTGGLTKLSGAFGNLASSVTVAASSFKMEIANPQSLLDAVNLERLYTIVGHCTQDESLTAPTYVEPATKADDQTWKRVEKTRATESSSNATDEVDDIGSARMGIDDSFVSQTDAIAEPLKMSTSQDSAPPRSIRHGKVQRLGDFIDTDALAPAEVLVSATTPDQLGEFCLIHTHPEFRRRVKEGYNIVVAGEAFGCGSSRENAVTALMGAGVQCVIAKSFAFIYGRNQPNLGLLGITMRDPRFYEAAVEGAEIKIDLEKRVVEVKTEGGNMQSFEFQLSRMERQLIECGGIAEAFGKWGQSLWEALCSERPAVPRKQASPTHDRGKEDLQW